MAFQVVWPAVSVADKRDPKNVKDGIVVKRGAKLPDWVDEFTIHVLTSTGAVKYVEELDPVLAGVESPPAPVLLQEHDPAMFNPPDLTGTTQDPAVKTEADLKTAKPKNTDPNRPADSATKADWLKYARSVESDPAKKAELTDEKTTRAELISTYG